jgi:steroid 5-alpha reductase family enzyme
VADWQKFVFKNREKNRGLWIQSGLWNYSRHPNYFGEILLWWGIFLYVTPFIQGLYWISVIGPLFITFILLFVSGIPLLEKKYDKKYVKNEKYQKYKSSTSVLILLPKKR